MLCVSDLCACDVGTKKGLSNILVNHFRVSGGIAGDLSPSTSIHLFWPLPDILALEWERAEVE